MLDVALIYIPLSIFVFDYKLFSISELRFSCIHVLELFDIMGTIDATN